ncbi:MAG TPA: ABC transporter permease [Steroidobacteraceae bacterium]|nr:ABC transporter permease [Steroidobacteraceae bacterium]
MGFFQQTGALSLLSARSLPQRLGASCVILVGIAGVVGVLVSILAMVTGLLQIANRSAHADRAVVMSSGTDSETLSNLSRDAVRSIADARGVRRDANNRPLASAEVLVLVHLPLRAGGSGNLTLRGVSANAFALRPELHVVAGRMFNPMLRELIVGRTAQRQFRDLQVGRRLLVRGAEWTVVGVFDGPGDQHESEMMTGVEVLQSTFQRNAFQSVTVQLDSAASFGEFRASLAGNPSLAIEVLRESDYYLHQSRAFARLLTVVAYLVGSIMAIGAIFGALNTMYAAVSARSVEIATLRVLGFEPGPIVTSVFAEALGLAALGGGLGGALAWLLFSGHAISTNGGGFTQLSVPVVVNAGLVGIGILWACVIGMVGASLPALRAIRAPLAAALKAT